MKNDKHAVACILKFGEVVCQRARASGHPEPCCENDYVNSLHVDAQANFLSLHQQELDPAASRCSARDSQETDGGPG